MIGYYDPCFDSFADFKFISSDAVEFPVHRFIIATASDVFKRMLITDMIEAHTGIAHFSDIDSSTMAEFLRFLYIFERQ